jgi:hypothetical protein
MRGVIGMTLSLGGSGTGFSILPVASDKTDSSRGCMYFLKLPELPCSMNLLH